MPELPEVEHLRLSLIPRLVGRVFTGVRIRRRDVIVAPGDPARGSAPARTGARPRRLTPAALLVGASITDLHRAGKQLAIVAANGRALCVHLGMSGQLRWLGPDAPRGSGPHEHITWRLDDGSGLAFRDPRRFGGVWVFPSFADLKASRWSGLGPDALVITAGELGARLDGSARPLKAALLDQSVIAGVGNIYADEALFAAGLSPTRLATSLTRRETAGLVISIRTVLRVSISAGGSTLRDYLDAEGKRGNNQSRFLVYGRRGRPCTRCGNPLESLQIAQRTTVMCPRCQK
jgi:formamidopyrimidine-DNA glycosylase